MLGVEGINRTLIQFNTSFPVWNESFPYVVPQGVSLEQHKVVIKVYDHDATGAIDQFGLLGQGEIDLATLAKKVQHADPGELVEHSLWVPLRRQRKRAGGQWKRLKGRDRRGSKVHVSVKWMPATGAAKHMQMAGVLVGDDDDDDEEEEKEKEKGEGEGSQTKSPQGSKHRTNVLGQKKKEGSGTALGQLMRKGSSMLNRVLPSHLSRSKSRIRAPESTHSGVLDDGEEEWRDRKSVV